MSHCRVTAVYLSGSHRCAPPRPRPSLSLSVLTQYSADGHQWAPCGANTCCLSDKLSQGHGEYLLREIMHIPLRFAIEGEFVYAVRVFRQRFREVEPDNVLKRCYTASVTWRHPYRYPTYKNIPTLSLHQSKSLFENASLPGLPHYPHPSRRTLHAV